MHVLVGSPDSDDMAGIVGRDPFTHVNEDCWQMTYRQFVVPTDEDLRDVIGVTPKRVHAEEEWVRQIRVENVAGQVLTLVYDPIGQYVNVHLSLGGAPVYEAFREGAVLLKADRLGGEPRLVVSFKTEELAGDLVVYLGDHLHVVDNSLFS